ncbi:hypothetical protein [Devosia sp. SL43]|uniref:hypothetical protein n=1 Tax=Devosia sp. SL43 TaxID=2806348 RepID=UPI001F3FCFA7|nr:hypothetical protein [Devosia sp. SL43]UJW84196.1 EF-hand domain-containing protein [Devosia sp. SL43]
MNKIALSFAIAGLSATVAFAQTPTTFADVDADANGELGFAELVVAWPDLTQAEFDVADVDKSGGLTADELNSLQPSAVPAVPATPEAPAEPVPNAGG